MSGWTFAYCQDNPNSGIIYGEKHAYVLTAPKGWVLDNESGVPNGLYAVFYPKGSSWDGETVMYTNTALLEKSETINDVIKYDIERFKKESPGLQVNQKDSITTTDKNKKAIVYYFSGDRNKNYEAVSYIAEKDITVFIVMTSRTEKGFISNINPFMELVKSYSFWTDKVTIEK